MINGIRPKFYFKISLKTRTKPNIVIRFWVWLVISLLMGMKLPLKPKEFWIKQVGVNKPPTISLWVVRNKK